MQLTSLAGSSPVAVSSRTGGQLGEFSAGRAPHSSGDGGSLVHPAGLLVCSSGSARDDTTALLPQSVVHAATGALTLANRGGSDAVSSFNTVDSYDTSAWHSTICSPHAKQPHDSHYYYHVIAKFSIYCVCLGQSKPKEFKSFCQYPAC